MKSCVIGGAGFIGGYVTRQLVASGREVVVLDRSPQPAHELPPKVNYISGDYSDRGTLRDVISEMDELIDLAYTTVPKTSFEDPIYDIVSNLPQSVGMIQEALSVNIKKLLIISSGGTVYGQTSESPIKEDHPTNPISPYGITKLTIEKYALMYAVLEKLPVVIVRPGNAYGNEQAAFTGQGFIATAIQSILNNQPVDIFGNPGTVRDYIHVSDIAKGIVAALDFGRSGMIYNIGSGIGLNNTEVVETLSSFAKQDGYQPDINYLPLRKYDVPFNILDCSKLTEISGWKPTIPFPLGVEKAWKAALSR